MCVVRGSVMHFPTPFPDLSRQEDIYWTGKMWKNLLKYTSISNIQFFTNVICNVFTILRSKCSDTNE